MGGGIFVPLKNMLSSGREKQKFSQNRPNAITSFPSRNTNIDAKVLICRILEIFSGGKSQLVDILETESVEELLHDIYGAAVKHC